MTSCMDLITSPSEDKTRAVLSPELLEGKLEPEEEISTRDQGAVTASRMVVTGEKCFPREYP